MNSCCEYGVNVALFLFKTRNITKTAQSNLSILSNIERHPYWGSLYGLKTLLWYRSATAKLSSPDRKISLYSIIWMLTVQFLQTNFLINMPLRHAWFHSTYIILTWSYQETLYSSPIFIHLFFLPVPVACLRCLSLWCWASEYGAPNPLLHLAHQFNLWPLAAQCWDSELANPNCLLHSVHICSGSRVRMRRLLIFWIALRGSRLQGTGMKIAWTIGSNCGIVGTVVALRGPIGILSSTRISASSKPASELTSRSRVFSWAMATCSLSSSLSYRRTVDSRSRHHNPENANSRRHWKSRRSIDNSRIDTSFYCIPLL